MGHWFAWGMFGLVWWVGHLAFWAIGVAAIVRLARRWRERNQRSRPAAALPEDVASRLPADGRRRVRALRSKAAEIRAELTRTDRLDVDLYAGDLARLDELVETFAELALDEHRAKRHLAEVDAAALAKIEDDAKAAESTATDAATRERAKRRRELAAARIAVNGELSTKASRLEAELVEIEQTVWLLSDRLAAQALSRAGTPDLSALFANLAAVGDALGHVDALGPAGRLGESASERTALSVR